jgi:heme ABC exporter ATP-binding subunit CcmA
MHSNTSPHQLPVVDVHELTKSFGRRRALAGVSFSLSMGECLAVFGPNGAGKTTLLRVLAGLLAPSSGKATVSGVDLPAGADVRRRVGLISHQTMLYEALSPRENVAFAAELYGVQDIPERVEDTLRRMAMLERADAPVRSLSRGMQQRVSIARAMVHAPQLVLADEPYSGLDESGARALTELLQDLRSTGTTIIIVTHNLAEGLALASRAAVMNRGRVVREDDRNSVDIAAYPRFYREALSAHG